MKPVEALLEVAGHPDADICAISFNFWHRLARSLSSAFSSTSRNPQASFLLLALLDFQIACINPTAVASKSYILPNVFWHEPNLHGSSAERNAVLQDIEAEQQRRKAPFYPAFSKLVALIQGKVRYPDNWDRLSDDEKKDFRHSRYEVSDTLLDAAGRKSIGNSLQESSSRVIIKD